jgi:hypothetical protein
VRKVKDSPASAGIGAVGGAVVGYGVKTAVGHSARKGNSFIPADPIEVPDDGEVYADEPTSYGESED